MHIGSLLILASANPGGASFEKVAKVFQRMASVYEKQFKWGPEAFCNRFYS